MGLTIEFYSAEPQELISLFAEDLDAPLNDAYMNFFLQKRQTFPRADFPSRLLLPEDLDNLCQIINAHDPSVPLHFENLCIQHLWDDGQGTEILMLLSESFARILAEYSESGIEQLALAWASTFPSEESLPSTPAYQSVLQLREVACDVVINGKSLIYHLAGDPQFFEYLRHI